MPCFFDTHAHLDYPEYAPDFPEVLARAQAAGIDKIISIGTSLESSQRSIRLAEQFPMIYAAVGWHPGEALEAPADLRPALRELARLWLDDSVPDPVTAYAAAHGIREQVQASVIMVGLEGSPADEWLIRYAARLAELSDATLQAVYVRAIDNLDQPPAERLEKDRRLLGELGGSLLEVRAGDPASGLLQAARRAGACQLVIGLRRRSRWSRLLNGSSVADQVLQAAGDLPVQVVNVGQPDKASREWRRQTITSGDG